MIAPSVRLMSLGGNSEDDPSHTPLADALDQWETLLKAIAEDVRHIRSLVTWAWWSGWIVLAVVIAVVILID